MYRATRIHPRSSVAGVVLVTFALVVASCGRLQERPAPDSTPSEASASAVTIEAGPATPPIPFITNHGITGLPGPADVATAAQAGGGLMGWVSPIGVSSPDGRYVAYNAWTELVEIDPEESWSSQGIETGQPVATPSIRLLDLSTGQDVLLEDGAFSLAWRADGTIAYFKGSERDYRVNEPYPGTVLVRSAPDADPVAWVSKPGQYIVHSWSRDSLLVYGETGLLAVDAPDQVRVLSDQAGVIALSPDGSRVLVTHGSSGPIELIDVASGKVVAALDISYFKDPFTGATIALVNDAGSWVGEWAAAQATLDPEGSAIVVLRVSEDSVHFARALVFATDGFPMGVSEPQLLDADGHRVVAWAPVKGAGGEAKGVLYVYLDCDLERQSCIQGPTREDRTFHPVYNPSRP